MINRRSIIIGIIILATALMVWRFVRPMNIFVVTENFERPVSTLEIPDILETLSARECAGCHQEFYDEWQTTIHSKAWTEPYFQKDFEFDGSQQICRNCHTPLDRQQENLVLGFRDAEKWDPILAHNPRFDPDLQKEGVTCAACHLREGKILGTFGSELAPHPVNKIEDGNQICVACHVVDGQRWDTFFKFPPCGTVAEIQSTAAKNLTTKKGKSGEVVVSETSKLGCVNCHMPVVERALVKDGEIRKVRQHLWRGGHDPQMVKSGLTIKLAEAAPANAGKRNFNLTITNTGAAHYLPTGTPR